MREIEFKASLGEEQIKRLRQSKRSAGLVTGVLAVALAWVFSAITLGPSQLEFGSLPVGSDSRLPVKLTNRGLTEFHAASIAVEGDSSDFRMNQQQCLTVAPGESCEVWVEFRPREPGIKMARLTVRTKDGDELSSSFTGKATSGIAPVEPPPQPPPELTHRVDPIANPQPLPPVPGPLPPPVNPPPPDVNQPEPQGPPPPPSPPPVDPHPPIYPPPYDPASENTPEPPPPPVTRPTPRPGIQVNPKALDFSQPSQGRRQVVVSNPGNGPLGLGFALAGADRGSFVYDRRNCGAVLPALSQCVVTLSSNPGIDSQERALNAWLAVSHNASGVTNPQTVALSWKPSMPQIIVQPRAWDFSQPPLRPAQVVISNPGDGALSLRFALAGSDRGSFAYSPGACGSVLQARSRCVVTVSYNGGIDPQERALNALLAVNHNASNASNPQTVALSWKPSIPPPGHPHVTATPNPVQFTVPPPGTEVFAPYTKMVSVTNDGMAGMKQLSVRLASQGNHQSPFSTGQCSPTLDAGQSCQLQVGFLPGGAQQYDDQLNVFEGVTRMASVSLQARSALQPPIKYRGDNNRIYQPPPGNTQGQRRPRPPGPQTGNLPRGGAGQIDSQNAGTKQGKAPPPIPPKYQLGGLAPQQTNTGTKQATPKQTPRVPPQNVPSHAPVRQAKKPPPPPPPPIR